MDTFDQKIFEGTAQMNGQDKTPELEQLRQKAKIDLSRRITKPPAILEIYENGEYRRFASAGDFSLIIGKAKARKSFFISLLSASFIKGDLFMDKIMPRPMPGRKRIIVFDTEQSHYDVQTQNERILRSANVTTCENLDVYHLRAYDTGQRIELIEHILYTTPDILLVVIDGIRDLVKDINSPDEASKIKDMLLKWTEERNIHIVCVLHQNKNDNNARGHLGTELTNKAETVLSIEKDEKTGLSIVKPEYTRGREFKAFTFLIDAEGLPRIVDPGHDFETTMDQKRDKKKKAPNNYPAQTHCQILDTVYSHGEGFRYSDLQVQVKLAFDAAGVNIGNNGCIEMITYYKNKKWIHLDKSGGGHGLYRRGEGILEPAPESPL